MTVADEKVVDVVLADLWDGEKFSRRNVGQYERKYGKRTKKDVRKNRNSPEPRSAASEPWAS